MRKITLLLLAGLMTTPVLSDTIIGVGQGIKTPGEDRGAKPLSFSFTMEENTKYPWSAGIRYISEYEVYRTEIKEHVSIFVDKRVIDWDITDNLTAYLTMGLAAHSELSIVNSSRVNFSERFGLEYNNFRLNIHHTSNAGIVPPNEGETTLSLEYRFKW